MTWPMAKLWRRGFGETRWIAMVHRAPLRARGPARRDPPRGQTRRRTPTDTHTPIAETVRRAVTRGLALGERPFITEPTEPKLPYPIRRIALGRRTDTRSEAGPSSARPGSAPGAAPGAGPAAAPAPAAAATASHCSTPARGATRRMMLTCVSPLLVPTPNGNAVMQSVLPT